MSNDLLAFDALKAMLQEFGLEEKESCKCSQCNAVRGGRTTIASLESAPYFKVELPVAAWITVTECLPKSGVVVFAYYKNEFGNGRRIRAAWVAAKTEESGPESDIGEYNEADDTYYDPEGWYEQINNCDDFCSICVKEGEVTHWMPLPPPPPDAQSEARSNHEK